MSDLTWQDKSGKECFELAAETVNGQCWIAQWGSFTCYKFSVASRRWIKSSVWTSPTSQVSIRQSPPRFVRCRRTHCVSHWRRAWLTGRDQRWWTTVAVVSPAPRASYFAFYLCHSSLVAQLSPVSTTPVDGPSTGPSSTRLVETRTRQHGPCSLVMETGHPSTRFVYSGRQLG